MNDQDFTINELLEQLSTADRQELETMLSEDPQLATKLLSLYEQKRAIVMNNKPIEPVLHEESQLLSRFLITTSD